MAHALRVAQSKRPMKPQSAAHPSRADTRPRRGAPVLWTPTEVAWLQRHFPDTQARVLRARFAHRCFADVYAMA